MTCRELTRLVATDELRESPWRRRLAARLHTWMCPHCREYRRQVRAVGEAAREHVESRSSDAATLERLERDILDQICGERRRKP